MKKNLICLGLILLFASPVSAYEFLAGDWLVSAGAGASINVIREDSVTRETPGAGALFVVELEYMLDDHWSVFGGVRPMVSPGFVDVGFGLGAKYRWTPESAPFIPYVSLSVTPAVLIPVGYGKTHFNVGARPAVGCEYFVIRDLAVGVELGIEPSVLMGSAYYRWFELSVDVLAKASWRF